MNDNKPLEEDNPPEKKTLKPWEMYSEENREMKPWEQFASKPWESYKQETQEEPEKDNPISFGAGVNPDTDLQTVNLDENGEALPVYTYENQAQWDDMSLESKEGIGTKGNAIGLGSNPWLDPVSILTLPFVAAGMTSNGVKALGGIIPDTLGSMAASGLEDEHTVAAMGAHVAVDVVTGKFLKSLAEVATSGKSIKSVDELYSSVATSLENLGVKDAQKVTKSEIEKLLKDNKITEADLVQRVEATPTVKIDEEVTDASADGWANFIEQDLKEQAAKNIPETNMTHADTAPALERFTESKAMRDEGIHTQVSSGRVHGAGNLSRMNTSNDVKRIIEEVAHDEAYMAKYESEGGGYQSLESVEEGADAIVKAVSKDLGLNLSSFAKNYVDDTKELAKRATAVRIITLKMAEEVDELAVRAELSTSTVLDQAKLIAAHTEFMNFKAYTEAGTSNIARGLSAHNINAEASSLSFLDMDARKFEWDTDSQIEAAKLVASAGGKDAVLKIAKEIKGAKTQKAKLKLLNKNRTALQGVLDYARASMLTSPKTLSANLVGNVMRPAMDNMSDYGTAFLMMGRKTPNKMTFGEAAHRSKVLSSRYLSELVVNPYNGLVAGVKGTSRSNFLGALTEIMSGTGLRKAEARLENTGIIREYKEDMIIPKTIDAEGQVIDSTENIFQTVGRELGAFQRLASFGLMKLTDNPFTKMAYDTELSGILYREFRGKGLGHAEAIAEATKKADAVNQFRTHIDDAASKGETKAKFKLDSKLSKEEQAAKLKELQDLDTRAKDYAKAVTWRDSSSMDFLESFSGSSHPVALIAKITTMPFIKTPTNITSYALRHTPLAITSGRWWKAVRGHSGEVEQARAWAQAASGSIVLGSVMAMMDKGWITGSFNFREKAMMEKAGIPENSIKLGDTWYSYNRIEPLGTMLGLAVNLRYSWEGMENEEDYETKLFCAAGEIGSSIYGKSYLTSVGDILRLFDSSSDDGSSAEAWQRFTVNQASKFIPMSSAAKFVVNDGTKYATDTALEGLAQRFGLGSDIVEHDGILGEEIIRPSTYVGTKMLKDDAPIALKMMVHHNMNVGRWKPTINGVELKAKYREEIKSNLAKIDARGEFEKLVQDENFKQQSPEMQKIYLQGVLTQLRDNAKAMFMSDNPNLTEQAYALKNETIEGMFKEEAVTNFNNTYDLLINRRQKQNKDKLKIIEDM